MKRVPSGIAPLLTVDRNSPQPLHRQIYDAYRDAILNRALRPGQRVPSTRGLALELRVSRIPVLNAYAQLLAEGYFESRVGAGTAVARSLPEQLTSCEPGSGKVARKKSGPRPAARFPSILHRLDRVLPWLGRVGPFAVGQPSLEGFPVHVWSSLVTRHGRKVNASSLHYPDPMGSLTLRETIAAYLRTARAVRCEADQIMIVSGSQHALELTARVLLDGRSRVWMEEPGYSLARNAFVTSGCELVPVPVDMEEPGYSLARNAFVTSGCELVPVPVDEEGLNVAAGIRRSPKARAAFVTPSHQYPLGVMMSASRRLQLLDWAQTSGSWIIEDDYDSEYRYESQPIAALQGLDRNERVIYIGTFSKVFFPALRLGYMVLPRDLITRFLAVRLVMDMGSPVFHQDVLADFIREGHFARHIRRMRLIYGERRRRLAKQLRERLGTSVDLLGGEAGLHLTVALRRGGNDRELSALAAREKLWLLPLSPSYRQRPARQGFILGFGSTGTEAMPEAVGKMQRLLGAR